MTFCELLCKRCFIIIHSLVELLFRNIHVVYLDVANLVIYFYNYVPIGLSLTRYNKKRLCYGM